MQKEFDAIQSYSKSIFYIRKFHFHHFHLFTDFLKYVQKNTVPMNIFLAFFRIYKLPLSALGYNYNNAIRIVYFILISSTIE